MAIRIPSALLLVCVLAAIVWFNVRRPEPPLDQPALLAQVRQLNQLATVRYTVQKIVTLEEAKQPFGSERILLVLQATVDAGIDLAGLRPQDVSVAQDGSVRIQLPAAAILTAAVDEQATKVWDRQKTWWTPWVPYSKDLEQRARATGLEAVKAGAVEMGILKHAERNAEASIRGLLNLAGVKSVTIVPASAS